MRSPIMSEKEQREFRRSRSRSPHSRKKTKKSNRREKSRSRSREDDRNQYSRKDRERNKEKDKRKTTESSGSSEKRNNDRLNKNNPDEPPPVMSRQRKPKNDDITTKTGGAYIPPARLKMMQQNITDKSSAAYQRIAWEALKKSIHGLINKVNTTNIGVIVRELLRENIVRGRGLLCRSLISAQNLSPTFTHVYAALIAVVNSKFPNIGELLLKRCVMQFRRAYKRNDKSACITSATFIAHMVNQQMAHEIIALEMLTLLVECATDDSIEVAIAFLKECGQKLSAVSGKGVNAVFEMLRNTLHEGNLDKRVQYMIEVMFQVRKDKFKDFPALLDDLDLVEEEDQITHLITLDEPIDVEDTLNVFRHDPEYELHEEQYSSLKKEILGDDSDDEDDDGEDDVEEGEEDDDEEEEGEGKEGGAQQSIVDKTESNLIAFRRTIYLTINSSLDFEECAHKLLKMQIRPGQQGELCNMFLDCCAEQRTYEKFYGLLAQRFCQINKIYREPLEGMFASSYSTIHRLDTNRLRNVAKFFAHLLITDAISWQVLSAIRLNEEDTTASSRIFIKILFQELAEYMGLPKLNARINDPTLADVFSGLFPRDHPKKTRFSINFFTTIGLGGLTDELRNALKAQVSVPVAQPPPPPLAVKPSPVSERPIAKPSHSYSSSSSSESPVRKKKSKKSKKRKKHRRSES